MNRFESFRSLSSGLEEKKRDGGHTDTYVTPEDHILATVKKELWYKVRMPFVITANRGLSVF